MKLRIEVDGSPISVSLSSIQIQRELSARTSSASFRVPVNSTAGLYDAALYDVSSYSSGDVTIPNQQSVVEIFNDDTDDLIFGGFVCRVSRDQLNRNLQWWNVTCVGWEALLEAAVISHTWTGKTDSEIITEAFDLLPEIDVSGIETLSVALDYIAKDQTLREVLERISSLSGAEYYISPAKELIYRAAGSVAAPITISDEPDSVTSFAWRDFKPDRSSVGFANSIEVLGAFTGVGGVELRATAENSTSIAEIGLRARRIVARDVDNQPALDLLAGIELDRRAVQESITFQTDAPVDVGQLLEISSVGAGVQGTFAVQTVKIRQRSQTATVFEVSVGDVRTSIAERLRQLDRIRTGPKLVVVPPAVVLPDSITSLELQDGAVTELKLAEEAVTTSRIALEAITDDLLVSSGITRIADNAISTPKLQANSVVSATIASNQILTNHISAGQIVGSKIQSGSITSAHAIFAAAAIQSADINTLSASKIATGTLTVGSGGITVAGNISGSLLDNGSVGDVKIASGLSASKITTGTLAVGSGGITVSGNISGSLLDNGSIGDVKIASGLSAAKITTGTLTVGGTVTVSGSINASVCTITNINASNISTGSMSASRLSAGTITASVSINSGGTFTVTDASVLNGVTVVNGTLTLNSTTSALGSVTVSNTLNVNGGGSYRMNGNSVISNSTFEGSNGVNTNGLINTNSVYQRNNVTVINSSSSFVGSGVAVQSNGVGCGGVNIWNGSSYNFGQTATVIGSFTIGGVPKTNLVFQGGVLVSYS